MRKPILIIIALFVLLNGAKVYGQSTLAEQLASHISLKMRDSLKLTDEQQTRIYQINLELHRQKLQVRGLYRKADSLQMKYQEIENTRDGLYQVVLSSDEKYQLYKKKKSSLVNAN
ncbi:hypothetical protein [Mucilaginibacter lacusdianchii]|uniref:hypothetical protein n=1 Tax=Mucilaginibacter lacusdianchii TaxID=2684211 RepID=UPI00131E94E8|nr:hypothetical protein [Mucilaginibacter sp. JXJ CY 39]